MLTPSCPAKHPRALSTCPYQVSKAARQEKRFQDYNERCTFHHQARVSREETGVGEKVRGLGWMARQGPKIQIGWVLF